MCENGFSQKIKKLQVLKKMLQFNEKVDIKGEDNIIQYRVTAKVKVSEDKKLNSGNEQGNKKISKKVLTKRKLDDIISFADCTGEVSKWS